MSGVRLAVRALVLDAGRLLLVNAYPGEQSDLWCAPGGGVEAGASLEDNLRREVHEETGLHASVGRPFHIGSIQRVIDENVDMHSVRIVYSASVPQDSPQPRVIEVDGSTVDARWHNLDEVVDRRVPLVEWARAAISAYHESI